MKFWRYIVIGLLVFASPVWAAKSQGGAGSSGPSGNGVNAFAGAGFMEWCSSQVTGVGPGAPSEMIWAVIYQPTPFSYANGQMYYFGATADATVQYDVCNYAVNAAGTTANLIADTGLIAIANTNTNVNLGTGTSNLTTQPTSTTCGSGTSGCIGGIFPPGYYAVGFAAGAGTETGKLKSCAGIITYTHATTTGATGGECPLAVTTSLTPSNGAGNIPDATPW